MYEKAWWDNSAKSWVDEQFHVLDNVTLYDRERWRTSSRAGKMSKGERTGPRTERPPPALIEFSLERGDLPGRPAGSNSPATRSSAGFAMLTGCIDLDSQEGDAIQRFTKSADNSAPICFPYCAWICLDSWVSFDLPLASELSERQPQATRPGVLYLSRRGMRRFHESRIVLQLSGRKQAVILIVTSRKEEHHGLVSRAVDRGRATRRQRGTVLSSQPPNSRKDARALVVAHRAHASACGQGCRSQSGHRPAIRGRVSAGGLGRLAAVESQSPGEPGPRRGGPPIAS